MSKWLISRNRKDFENSLVNAFMQGMICGYAVDHEHLVDDERVYENRFRAYISGKINCMSEIYNNEKITMEKRLK